MADPHTYKINHPTPSATPPPLASFSQTLSDTIRATTIRTERGQLIYGPIAELLDSYLQSDQVRKLPTQSRRPLLALCKDLITIANGHFDAYIKGSRYTLAAPDTSGSSTPQSSSEDLGRTSPTSSSNTKHTTTTLSYPLSAQSSYAEAAASPPPVVQRQTKIQKQAAKPAKRQAPLDQLNRPDTRLFLRIDQGHPAREAGSFAIQTLLKRRLGEDAYLIKEVQEVNTGFALCTGSFDNLTALECHSTLITNCITKCTIERQKTWTMYRLDYIPRSIQILDDNFQPRMVKITANDLSEAIRDCTGQQPTRTAEASFSAQKGLFNTSWFVFFESANHTLLPKTLRIFSSTVPATLVKNKPKIVQCTRCFQWHNTRCCTRPNHCRLCGSPNHQENTHPPCAALPPHICPPRCLHCGGPHPADDKTCPLRPNHKEPITKHQRAIYIKTCKASRLRTCASSPCIRHELSSLPQTTPIPSMDIDTADPTVEAQVAASSPPHPPPVTPPRQRTVALAPPATATAVRHFVASSAPLSSPHLNV